MKMRKVNCATVDIVVSYIRAVDLVDGCSYAESKRDPRLKIHFGRCASRILEKILKL